MEWQSINSEVSGFLAFISSRRIQYIHQWWNRIRENHFLECTIAIYTQKMNASITIEDNAELQIQKCKESGKTGSKKCKCRRNRRSYHQGSDQVGTSYETGQDHRGGSALGGSN